MKDPLISNRKTFMIINITIRKKNNQNIFAESVLLLLIPIWMQFQYFSVDAGNCHFKNDDRSSHEHISIRERREWFNEIEKDRLGEAKAN